MTPARKTTTTKSSASKTKTPAKKTTAPKTTRAPKRKVLLTSKDVKARIEELAARIQDEFRYPEALLLIGIRTRGVFLAERLKALLDLKYGQEVPTGVLDITFYRDDLSRLGPNPMVRGSELPFDIHDANIILVDDVLYTGRTIRAALDELADFGRPAFVRLAIMVDRGLREYPIQPDYCGLKISTTPEQHVVVMLEETDDEDKVVLEG